MIAFDTLRGALTAADPHTELDRLIRAELGTGRRTADIYDDLLPLARLARERLPLTGEASLALTGSLDALTGDCDPDQCYQDPPTGDAAGYTVTFPDRAAEARGLGFLVGKFLGQVRANGVHVIPRDALTALADQNIPFTFVGTTGGG